MAYAEQAMSRPKICVLVSTPLAVHFFLRPHLKALSDRFEVTLVSNFGNDAYLNPLDLPVQQVNVGIQRKIALWQDLVVLFKLYSLFRREHFDLVITVTPKAGLLGMVAAALAFVKRRVHIFQGEVWYSRRGFMRGLLKLMDRIVAKSATHLLAVSSSEKEFLEKKHITDPGRMAVLGSGSISGVDTIRFRPNPAGRVDFRRERGIPDDAVVCLFLGRITADKGVFDLVRAFNLCSKNHPKLWLVLAGPDEECIGSQLLTIPSPEASAQMLLEGFTSIPECYLASADFLCLPSYREGFGMVVIEAASAGIPSIGSRIYGVRDALIDGVTGLLVQPGDVPRLAEAISILATDSNLRHSMGNAGRIRVQREFTQLKVIAEYVDYFAQILGSDNMNSHDQFAVHAQNQSEEELVVNTRLRR